MADDMVTIAEFTDISEAEMKRGILETEGIDAVLVDETSQLYTIGAIRVFRIRLQVPAAQGPQAIEILEHLGEDPFS